MRQLIKQITKPVFETDDGVVHDTWYKASEHILKCDVTDFVDRHAYSSMGRTELKEILLEHWAVLASAFEAHNKRLTDGAPQ